MKLSVEQFTHPNTGFTALPSVYEVDGDEKAFTLIEMNLAPAEGGLLHRYQIIIVWREGLGRCQYIENMGLASLCFTGAKSVQSAAFTDDRPTDWCHSVDEVREYADRLREIDIKKFLGIEPEDLVAGFHDRVEEFSLQKNHVSVSGPLFKVERY